MPGGTDRKPMKHPNDAKDEGILSSDEFKLVKNITKHYYANDHIPSELELSDYLSKVNYKSYTKAEIIHMITKPRFRAAIENRGIPYTWGNDSVRFTADKKELSYKQVVVANALLDPHDVRSVSRRLKDLGVTRAQYQGWCRFPPFIEYIKRRGEELFGANMGLVDSTLTRKALEGDMQAIKFFYEITGRYNQHKTVESMSVQFVLARVVQVIQTHVKDPEILRKISDDFSKLIETDGLDSINSMSQNRALQGKVEA